MTAYAIYVTVNDILLTYFQREKIEGEQLFIASDKALIFNKFQMCIYINMLDFFKDV